jgi:hypothetical protein
MEAFMAEMKKCKAMVEFRLNSPDQTDGVMVKAGDQFEFDGVRAKTTDVNGLERIIAAPQLRSLSGEWYEEIAIAEQDQAQSVPTAQKSSVLEEFQKVKESESKSSGGSSAKPNESVEESLPGGDGPPQDLNKMVEGYEKQTSKGSAIIDDDASFVKETTPVDGAAEGNKPGVISKEASTDKKPVVSHEERLAKETSYEESDKIESSQPKPRKKPEIISDGQGEVVGKTTNPAIYKDEMNKRDSKLETKTGRFRENDVAKQTDYEEEGKPTKIGSSTQTQTTSTAKKSGSKSKRAAKKASTGVQAFEPQEGKVVAKTRKTNNVKETADGFRVESSVGSSQEMEVPEATSESNDQVIVGKATVGKGSDTPVDIGSDDVDIGDILEGV